MFTLGILLQQWYPGLIKNDNWWRLQCPPVAWTFPLQQQFTSVTDIIASTDYTAAAVGVSTKVAVNTTWDQEKCWAAAPVYNWTVQAWFMIFGHAFQTFWFLANAIIGGNGNRMHQFWMMVAKYTFVLPIAEILILMWTWNSYGSKQDVL